MYRPSGQTGIRDSIKFDNYLNTFDDDFNNIFKFYYYSPLSRIELNGAALIFDERTCVRVCKFFYTFLYNLVTIKLQLYK